MSPDSAPAAPCACPARLVLDGASDPDLAAFLAAVLAGRDPGPARLRLKVRCSCPAGTAAAPRRRGGR